MALDPDRSSDAAWSELERGFFAAAPPDVPVPPAQPMRFDDLDPSAPQTAPWRARLTRLSAWTAAARSAAGAAARRHRAVALALFRSRSRERRLIATAAAALSVVMGISAVVVASRSGGQAAGGIPLAIGAGGPPIGEAPPTEAPSPPIAPDFESQASAESIAPEAPPRLHRKHGKHAKGPGKHSRRANAKTTGKVTRRGPSARSR